MPKGKKKIPNQGKKNKYALPKQSKKENQRNIMKKDKHTMIVIISL